MEGGVWSRIREDFRLAEFHLGSRKKLIKSLKDCNSINIDGEELGKIVEELQKQEGSLKNLLNKNERHISYLLSLRSEDINEEKDVNARVQSNIYSFSGASTYYTIAPEEGTSATYSQNEELDDSLPEEMIPVEGNGLQMWDSQLYEVVHTGHLTKEQCKIVTQIGDHFVHAAETTGKMIIAEQHISNLQKKIQVLDDVGGLAGGSKFKAHGLFFKYPVDVELSKNKWLYGGTQREDLIASKASNHDLKGFSYMMMADENNTFNYPLFSLFDYQGYRLMIMTELPITKDPPTLIYGSADGGRTVSFDQETHNKLHPIASQLNLREHEVTNARVPTYLCGDIEIHKFNHSRVIEGAHKIDTAYYVLDTARIFPPANLNGSTNFGAIFYKLFRPEFVAKYETPLVSDALSSWLFDPSFNSDIQRATSCLELGVKKFALTVIETKQLKKWTKVSKSILKQYNQPEDRVMYDPIIYRLHEEGINIRYLGLFLLTLNDSNAEAHQINHLVMIILSRILKNYWKECIRCESKNERVYDSCLTISLHILNQLICIRKNLKNEEFWGNILKKVQPMFCEGIMNSEDTKKLLDIIDIQLASINIEELIISFVNLCGIVLSTSTIDALKSTKYFKFDQVDIARFVPLLRIQPIINYYSGIYYYKMGKSANIEISKTKFNYFSSAGKKFLSILNIQFKNLKKYCAKTLLNALILERSFNCDMYLLIQIFGSLLSGVSISTHKEKFIKLYFSYLTCIFWKILKKDQKDLLVANEMEDPLKELVLESIQKRKDHLTAKKMCQSKALYSAMTLAQKSKILGFYYDKNLNKWMKSKNLKLKELANRELNKAVKYPLLKMKDTIKEILINESPELLNDLISSIKYWDLKPFERCIFLQIPLEVEDYFKFSLNHISKPNLQEYWNIILRNPLLNTLFDNWELYNRLHIDKITDHKIKPFLLKHNETEQRSIVHSSFFEQFLDILKQNEISLDEILDNYGNTALHLWSNHQCDIVETSNETKKWYLSSKFIMEADDFEPYLASENIRIDDLLKNKKWQGWTNYHPPKLQEYITVEIQHPYYNHKVIHFCLSGNISFNIESKNKYHKTPLHVATENGFSEIIELLLTRNAHVEAKDENGCSPLHIACQNGNKPNFDLLISFKANIEAQTKNLETPLHLACLNGHLPIVQALIQMKANIEAKDHHLWTPLYLASRTAHLTITQFLIDQKANVHGPDKFQLTPLHFASQNGHLSIVNVLTTNKADIQPRDDVGWTPLFWASQNGHLNIMKYLISLNANIEEKDENDCTALHVACEYGQHDVVRFLLENEANTQIVSKDGLTPLQLALKNGHTTIAPLFQIT